MIDQVQLWKFLDEPPVAKKTSLFKSATPDPTLKGLTAEEMALVGGGGPTSPSS